MLVTFILTVSPFLTFISLREKLVEAFPSFISYQEVIENSLILDSWSDITSVDGESSCDGDSVAIGVGLGETVTFTRFLVTTYTAPPPTPMIPSTISNMIIDAIPLSLF